MQETHSHSLDKSVTLMESEIESLIFPLSKGDRIHLTGDLGSGKSTLVRAIIRSHFSDRDLIVRSPTYTYYQKYGTNLYHFDLYRVEDAADILLIGALDILEDPGSICLIEWPEILDDRFPPTHTIHISHDGERRIYDIRKVSQ